MDFEFSQDQQLLAKTAAEFVARRSPVPRMRKLRDHEVGWESAVWREMAELGWLAIPFEESIGGMGGGFVEVALLLEQMGKELVPEPYVPSVVLAGTVLARGGSAEQKARFLAPMIEGKTSLALAHAERETRFDATAPGLEAKRDGAGFVLSGEKVWVENGHVADHIVVSARLEGEPALFVLDRGAAGLAITRVSTFDGRKAAMLRLDGVRVDGDRQLSVRPARELLELAMDHGAAAAVAEGVGLTQRVLDMTVDYLKTREQFGVKIGSFQALQHRAVDMFVEAQLIRSIALRAMVKIDASDAEERRRAISAAKVQLSIGGKYITRQSIQLHGGIGCTDEHDVGLYFKRMHVLNTLYGDEEHHVARVAGEPSFART